MKTVKSELRWMVIYYRALWIDLVINYYMEMAYEPGRN